MGVQQRSLVLFLESCRSEHTAKQYKYYLDKFMEFNHIDPENYNALLVIPEGEIQNIIADWIIHLKKTKKPNTVQPMLFGVKSFFEANDIELKWKKLQRLLPEKTKPSGRKPYTREQIQTMLEVTTELRPKALILFLATSGMRIGAIPELKIKHLKQFGDCLRVIGYDDTNKEYITFISPEAVKALQRYFNKRKQDGETLTDESPLFRTNFDQHLNEKVRGSKVKAATRATLQEAVRRVLNKAGLRLNKQGNRYDIQIDHGFRKFFNTAVKETPGIILSYAEMLLGHATSIPLDNNYLEANENKLFKEYQKVIPRITIDQTEQLTQEAEQAKIAAQQGGEKVKEVIDKYESKLAEMHKFYEAKADEFCNRLENMMFDMAGMSPEERKQMKSEADRLAREKGL